MSTFQPIAVDCPRCGQPTERFLATSLNLARAKVHFDAIEAGTFQRYTCPRCAAPYDAEHPFIAMHLRLAPPGNFLIAQLPRPWITDFREAERSLRQVFEEGLGDGAPPPAQSLGRGIFMRVTFGLDALREKLLCLKHGLDDLALEALKLQCLRELPGVALDVEAPPRLIAVEADGQELVTRWPGEGSPQVVVLSRGALEQLVDDPASWADSAALLRGESFVDLARLWLPAEPADDSPTWSA